MDTATEAGANLQRAIQSHQAASLKQRLEGTLTTIWMVRRSMLINVQDKPVGCLVRTDCQVLRLTTSQTKVLSQKRGC
ncbi:hypothetical protein KR52_11095 [Synechococcus sp. KORDI-52]|nr:hypothetical protein KR52_11095 [Synechococcus sp. KORDI-52]